MSRAVQELRREIRARVDERARLRDEAEELARRQEVIASRDDELRSQIEALEQTVAILQERVVEPEPVEPLAEEEPVLPEEVADETREHVRRELDEQRAARHEADGAEPVKRRRVQRDALTVHKHGHSGPREGSSGPRSEMKMAVDLTPEDIDLEDISPIWVERADLLFEWLIEQEGESASSYAMALAMADLFDCSLTTGQGIVTRAVRVLIGQRRIVWTGEKVAANEGDRRKSSPVWKVCRSGEEKAAPGVHDPDYEGTTTRWPTAGSVRPGEHLRLGTSGFEQGKKR